MEIVAGRPVSRTPPQIRRLRLGCGRQRSEPRLVSTSARAPLPRRGQRVDNGGPQAPGAPGRGLQTRWCVAVGSADESDEIILSEPSSEEGQVQSDTDVDYANDDDAYAAYADADSTDGENDGEEAAGGRAAGNVAVGEIGPADQNGDEKDSNCSSGAVSELACSWV
eukprot:evm.model.scf_517.2 EVM.evm.TU.scf_517.2   scf_517:9676-10715(+)